jgi:hypothetical protein
VPDEQNDEAAAAAEWAVVFAGGPAAVMLPAGSDDAAIELATMPGWTLARRVEGTWRPQVLTAEQFMQYARQRPGIVDCQIALGYFEGPNPGLPPSAFYRALIAAFMLAPPEDQLLLRQTFPELIAVSIYLQTSNGRDWLARVCENFRAAQLAEKAASARRPHAVTFRRRPARGLGAPS